MRRWLMVVCATMVLALPAGRSLAGFEAGVAASDRGDYQTAMRELLPLAEAGDERAQIVVAEFFFNGRGTPSDARQAAQWYLRAAQQGNAVAAAMLGMLYESGNGVAQDPREAFSWYLKAARAGAVPAQNFLAGLYERGEGTERSLSEAAAWYEKAASRGYAPAQNSLGTLFERGDGVNQDQRQAVAWYRKAAEQGDPMAATNLARMYYVGRGSLKRNYGEAAKWFRVAARKGYPKAFYNLGLLYEQGHGVPANRVIAFALCVLAVEMDTKNEVPAAREARDEMAPTLTQEERSAVRGIFGAMAADPDNMLNAIDAYAARPAVRERQVAAATLPAPTSGAYPARPAKRAGVVTCNTRCVNGDCWRTYDDGHQVHFQAKRVFDSLSGDWKWDGGSC